MRKIISLITITASVVAANAQKHIWTKEIGRAPVDESGYAVVPTFDSNFVVTGGANDADGKRADVLLMKIDKGGDTIWIRNYDLPGDFQFSRDIVQTTDSGFMIAGYNRQQPAMHEDFLLIRTDKSGNLLWSKKYEGKGRRLAGGMKGLTDGFIIAGSLHYNGITADAYLVRTDLNGDTLWTRTHHNGEVSQLLDVATTSDGGFILSGNTRDDNNTALRLLLMKVNEDGDLEWARKYVGRDESVYERGNKVLETFDSGFVVTGITSSGSGSEAWVLKTDAAGDTLWNYFYTKPGNIFISSKSLIITTDSNYLITADVYDRPAATTISMVLCIDKNGSLLWELALPYNGARTETNDICAVDNEHYLIVGSISEYSPSNQVFASVIKYEPSVGTFAGAVKSKEALILWPNPAMHTLMVEGLSHSRFQYEIYDMAGRVMQQGLAEQGRLPIEGLMSGVYLINVDKKHWGRFLKQ